MKRPITTISALGLLALGASIGQPSSAAAPQMSGFVGQGASSVAGCPFIIWRLVKHDDGTVTGIAYYSDLSGLSMVNGAINKSGQFHFELKSAMGNGPVATVDGTKPAKTRATATMRGEGCANMEIKLDPVENLRLVPRASQAVD